jgi:hypothetical protein
MSEHDSEPFKLPELQRIAATFQRNHKNAVGLLVLPIVIFMENDIRILMQELHEEVSIGVLDEPDSHRFLDNETREQFCDRLHKTVEARIAEKSHLMDEVISGSSKRAAKRLGEWRNSNQGNMPGYLRQLDLSCILSLWTCFEASIADAWIAAVNHDPKRFAFKVIQGLSDLDSLPEGMSIKSIPLGLLARYGFDLSSRIGDVLSTRIDFSNLKDARKAYQAAFKSNTIMQGSLSEPLLSKLCLLRNLIVHRAGVVDEQFKSAFGSTQEIGEDVALDADDISKYAECVSTTVTTILTALDAELSTSV